jgi:hypothetical protein
MKCDTRCFRIVRNAKHDHNDDNLASTRAGSDGQRPVTELDGNGHFHLHASS